KFRCATCSHTPLRLLVWSSRARSARSSHPHNLIAAIDINDLAGDRSGAIAPDKDTGLAQLGGVATAFQRRAFLVMFEHRCEPADPARGQRLNWSGRNAIHADFLWSKIVSEITRARFKAR